MEHTEEERRAFREEFRARRRRQWTLALPFLLLLAALALAPQSGASLLGLAPRLWVPVALAVLAGAVVFSLRNWRCPACNGYLGRGFGALLRIGCVVSAAIVLLHVGSFSPVPRHTATIGDETILCGHVL
ncbi:MAG: hypothetical protein ABR576_02230 [Thermoanaerobaculia bacterium]